MRRSRLGATGLEVSKLGLGTVQLGMAYGLGLPEPPPDEECIRLVHRALELGITYFDTASAYGRSEELLGRALAGLREQCFITTKMGFGRPRGRDGADLSPSYVPQALEASLRRLNTEYVDLYLAHAPDDRTPLGEMAGAFERLREQGKVRWWGISNFQASAVGELAGYSGFVAYQGLLNLVDRELLGTVVPACRQHQTGFMAYSPLAMGLLTGKYQEKPSFPREDFRAQYPYFQPQGFARAGTGLERLKQMASERGATAAQLALAWTVQRGEGVTVVGYKTPAQVRDNVAAADIVLQDHEARLLEELFPWP